MQNTYTPPVPTADVDPGSIVAILVKTSAVVFGIAGVIGSFILGNTYKIVELAQHSWEDPITRFNWGIALSGIVGSALCAILLYAFGELISMQYEAGRKQDEISAQLKKISSQLETSSAPHPDPTDTPA